MSFDEQAFSPLIFLCYAREDYPRIYSLYLLLKSLGLRPWMDKCDLIAGREWRPQIEEIIRTADFFIASFSKASVNKNGFIQREYRFALDALAERPPGSIFLIPVRLDDCEIPNLQTVGIRLPEIQWVDLFQTEDINENDIEPILKAVETQSKWRHPNIALLKIVKEYERVLDPALMETLRVKDLPYTDVIIEYKAKHNTPELLELGARAYQLYLSTSAADNYHLGLDIYYLVASYLYRAILSNNFTACKEKAFIYPIHQYLSKMIRSAPQAERDCLISTLIRWLISKEEVYETSRDFAAFELGMSKLNEATDYLMAALDDPFELPLVRYYAGMGLGMIGNPATLNNLIEVYGREPDPAMKKVIAHTLIHISKSRP